MSPKGKCHLASIASPGEPAVLVMWKELQEHLPVIDPSSHQVAAEVSEIC